MAAQRLSRDGGSSRESSLATAYGFTLPGFLEFHSEGASQEYRPQRPQSLACACTFVPVLVRACVPVSVHRRSRSVLEHAFRAMAAEEVRNGVPEDDKVDQAVRLAELHPFLDVSSLREP
jgi:hypothetical protein